MPSIKFTHKGDFSKTIGFLKRANNVVRVSAIEPYAQKALSALQQATPVESGITAKSWSYEIINTKGTITVNFINTNVNNNVPIAVIIQYGHATRNGGWVEGKDYINPAIQPIFDDMVEKIWGEVNKL